MQLAKGQQEASKMELMKIPDRDRSQLELIQFGRWLENIFCKETDPSDIIKPQT